MRSSRPLLLRSRRSERFGVTECGWQPNIYLSIYRSKWIFSCHTGKKFVHQTPCAMSGNKLEMGDIQDLKKVIILLLAPIVEELICIILIVWPVIASNLEFKVTAKPSSESSVAVGDVSR